MVSSTPSSTASTRSSAARGRHQQPALPAERDIGLDELRGEERPGRRRPVREVVLDLAPGFAGLAVLAVLVVLVARQPMAMFDLGQQQVGPVLVALVDDEVGAQPGMADAAIGQRLDHLGVDRRRPAAQVVDQLLVFGEVERIGVVAGIVGSAVALGVLQGLAGLVVAAPGVGGHPRTLTPRGRISFARSALWTIGTTRTHRSTRGGDDGEDTRRRTATTRPARVATAQPTACPWASRPSSPAPASGSPGLV